MRIVDASTLDFWPALFTALFVEIPYLLVAAAGLIFVRLRLKPEHSKARRWAAIGFGLLLLRGAVKGYVTARILVAFFADGGRAALAHNTEWTSLASAALLAAIACLVVSTLSDRAR